MIAAKKNSRSLRDRHSELVDKKFLIGLTAAERKKLARINIALDRKEEKFYAPIKFDLRKAMQATKKNKSVFAPFVPRAGMVFKENTGKNPRTAVLREKHDSNGRVWEAESVLNRKRILIPATKLHAGAYHDGWSRCEASADALPEKWGQVV